MFSRVSPCTRWLNSCATTPCSSSRVSRSSAPRVTATTASSGVQPAANALMASSRGSTQAPGGGMRLASAISCTMLAKRRSRRSAACWPEVCTGLPAGHLGHVRAAVAQAQRLEPAAAEHVEQHEPGVGLEEPVREADERHADPVGDGQHRVDRQHQHRHDQHEQHQQAARRSLRRVLVGAKAHRPGLRYELDARHFALGVARRRLQHRGGAEAEDAGHHVGGACCAALL